MNKSLYGLDNSHLVEHKGYQLESRTLVAYSAMAKHATQNGIKLEICSAYRGFDRQLEIFNGKATGHRSLLNQDSQPVVSDSMTNAELLDTILIWSALPGTSRHHWGTDIDLFDANAIDKSSLQLVNQEYEVNGPCHPLSLWLERHAQDYGFYRPFQAGQSGVSPEAWHYSYHPVSQQYLASFDIQCLKELLQHSHIELKDEILSRLESLIKHYVYHIAQPNLITNNPK